MLPPDAEAAAFVPLGAAPAGSSTTSVQGLQPNAEAEDSALSGGWGPAGSSKALLSGLLSYAKAGSLNLPPELHLQHCEYNLTDTS